MTYNQLIKELQKPEYEEYMDQIIILVDSEDRILSVTEVGLEYKVNNDNDQELVLYCLG